MYKIYYREKRFIDEVLERGEYDYVFFYPTIVDVGANIGTFSLFIYKHCHKIYALEPAPENFELLSKTVTDNKLEKIKPFEEALAGNTGTRPMRMIRGAGFGAWTITDMTGSPEDYIQVKHITLKEFMEREGIDYIDLLKMDVEGAEKEIFEDPTFPFDKIGTIICEFHYSNLGTDEEKTLTATQNRGWFKDILEDKGFVYYEKQYNHFLARKK